MESEIHRATCMICEAVCGLQVEIAEGAVQGVRGDPEDPLSQGHICPKATAIADIMGDPDRVRAPLVRGEEASWEVALEEAGRRIAEIQREHGRHSVALYLGNPVTHNHGAMLGQLLLGKAIATKSRFSATSLDQLPHMLAGLEMFGHQLLIPVPDLDRTDHLFVIGANPVASNGSLMTAPGIPRRLKALRARGGRLVVVDPRRTETAALADEWVAIRPGGDAALLAAMVHHILAEGLGHTDRVVIEGLDRLRAAVAPFTPERAAGRAGISAAEIRRLASTFAQAERAAAYGRMGTSTQAFGGVATWLITALNTITGNLDRPGGVMFPSPAADLVSISARTGDQGHFDLWRSRVRGLPEFGGELPVVTLAEEIETPGPGQIRALITIAGNPVLSSPEGSRLSRALASLEFMVSVDLHRNETTRHATVLLPPSFGFERSHHDLVFHLFGVRNTARYAPALVKPPPGVRHDFDILLGLGEAILRHGGGKGANRRLSWGLRAARAAGADRLLDLGIRTGPHGLGRGGLSLTRLRAQPQGLDLGPLEPQLPGRLYTRDGRVQLAPERLVADLPRLAAGLDEVAPPLVLIGRRHLRSHNSWLHNSPRLVKGRPRCTLQIHPTDAGTRGICEGDLVRIESRVGAVEAPAELTDTLRPGVVSLPHGWGHGRQGTRLSVASARPGVSVNDLTDTAELDPLTGNATLNGVPVEVSRAAQP